MSPDVQTLMQELRGAGGRAEESARALGAALKREGSAADALLIELLRDRHASLRWAALLSLEGRCENDIAPLVETLASLVTDCDPRVRRAAAATSVARALKARCQRLHVSVDAAVASAAPLKEQRALLLAEQQGAAFWNDRSRASAALDRMGKLDDVVACFEEWSQSIDRLVARSEARGFTDELERFHHRLSELEVEGAWLTRLLACGESELADTFLCIDLVESEGSDVDGVGKIGGMYRGLGHRRGFEVEVLDDRKGSGPAGEGLVLLLSGGGAYSLLAGEAGHHEVMRRAVGDRAGDHRDVVRVTVVPAPAGLEPDNFAAEVRVATGQAPEARGRLIPCPDIEVELFHEPSRTEVRARCAGPPGPAAEQLRQLLRARVEFDAAADRTSLVRRYELGIEPLVHDLGTGVRTAGLGHALEGRIDRFLVGEGEPCGGSATSLPH